MYKIATLNKISPAGLSQLGNEYTVTDDLASANGIIVRSADMHDMDFSDSLLAIARAGAGVNNIPLDKCAAQGIVVFNAPGANANAVKELVLAALLMSARNIPAAQAWANSLLDDPTIDINKEVEKGKGQFAGHELKGKTLGVIGLGAIGAHVANTASSLGMRVIGYDPFLSIKSAHLLNNDIPIVDELNELLPFIDISQSWNHMRFVILGGIMFLLIWGVYEYPKRKTDTYHTFPGAILSTLALVGVSIAFSVFIGASVKYSLVYGSLASIILLMMWLYTSSTVIYCGMALNLTIRDFKPEPRIKKTEETEQE